MKNRKFNYSVAALIIILMAVSCERKLDELQLDTNYPTTPEVFIDGFSSGLSYVVWGNVYSFSVDTKNVHNGTSSMEFLIPDQTNIYGSWTQSIFQDVLGRNLTGYNVLTFYAMSSTNTTLAEVGFGLSTVHDIVSQKYKTSIYNIPLTTGWNKYYIAIPNSSVLTNEKGLFYFVGKPQSNGSGYTVWIDDVKFENLGTLAHNEYTFSNFKDSILAGPIGKYALSNFNETINLPNGTNQIQTIAPGYFSFFSSNQSLATVVNDTLSLLGDGAVITGKVGNYFATGSLTTRVIGPSTTAPVPHTYSTADSVMTVYSNSNTESNVSIASYDPYWAPYMTTSYFPFSNFIRYVNSNDIYKENKVYVAITFTNPINVSSMKYFHMDVWVPTTAANSSNKPDVVLVTSTTNNTSPSQNAMATGKWVSLEIPISGFTGTGNKSSVTAVMFDVFPSDIYVDNIYFHK